jgi:SAM-dependent methyltransferase
MAGEACDANAAQRRYWNRVAGPRWAAAPALRERRHRESIALLLARLGLAGGESVLEIGCGTGAATLPLAAAVGAQGRLVAIDISEPMLAVARRRIAERGLHNITLLLGDAQVFAFEPAAFDVAASRMGVMFFAGPTASASPYNDTGKSRSRSAGSSMTTAQRMAQRRPPQDGRRPVRPVPPTRPARHRSGAGGPIRCAVMMRAPVAAIG